MALIVNDMSEINVDAMLTRDNEEVALLARRGSAGNMLQVVIGQLLRVARIKQVAHAFLFIRGIILYQL